MCSCCRASKLLLFSNVWQLSSQYCIYFLILKVWSYFKIFDCKSHCDFKRKEDTFKWLFKSLKGFQIYNDYHEIWIWIIASNASNMALLLHLTDCHHHQDIDSTLCFSWGGWLDGPWKCLGRSSATTAPSPSVLPLTWWLPIHNGFEPVEKNKTHFFFLLYKISTSFSFF